MINSIDVSEMISLESYRAAVGRWQFRTVSSSRLRKKQKLEPHHSVGSSNNKQVMKIYTVGIALLTAMTVLPIMLSCFTRNKIEAEHQKSVADLDTGLPHKVFQMLLVMGGIETNPGPEAENRNSLKGKQCEYCGGVFKSNLLRHKKRWHKTNHLIMCCFCQRPFERKEAWAEHMELEHKPRTKRGQVSNHAFQKRILEIYLLNQDDKLESALGEGILKVYFKIELFRQHKIY